MESPTYVQQLLRLGLLLQGARFFDRFCEGRRLRGRHLGIGSRCVVERSSSKGR